jgi:hypothetical protein
MCSRGVLVEVRPQTVRPLEVTPQWGPIVGVEWQAAVFQQRCLYEGLGQFTPT